MMRKKGYVSTILTCIGVIGVVVTAVMTAKATPKAIRLLEEAGDDLDKKEVVRIVAPVYIPAVAIGVSTIACIFGANVLNKRQQAAITSAYTLLNNYHKEYRKKLIDLHGKEADEKIRKAMVREHCGYHQIGVDVPDVMATFYDEISGESITCYEREIMDAEYHLNRNFVLRGYASLNEFYSFLGLPKTSYGDDMGWSITDEYYWIDFEHNLISRDDGGSYVYSIDMIFPPNPEYLREW